MAQEFTLEGIPGLLAKLNDASQLATKALAAGMFSEMEEVMTEAKRLTPVATGVLRASGTVLPPEVTGVRVTVIAGFGGAANAYAVPVHERLGAHHPVGQAKFLEQPFLARVAIMPEKLAEKVRTAWARLAR